MQRFPHHFLPMDPQVCPPPLASSQSHTSGLDKSPCSTYKQSHSRNSSTGSSKQSKQSRNWEVMEDLTNLEQLSALGSTMDLSIPGICEGYLMKRRKYPLKGWHKRYFLLEKGILKYSKTQQDIQRGKLHGSLDVSLAVMSINRKAKRIDLDAGDNLYHLMAKSHDLFYIWLTKLCAHRVYRKNEAMSVQRGVLHALSMGHNTLPVMSRLAHQNTVSPSAFIQMMLSCGVCVTRHAAISQLPQYASSASVCHTEMGSPLVTSYPPVSNKVSAWLQQTHDIDAASNDLAQCQAELTELAQLIQRLQWLEGGFPITNTDLEMRISMQNLFLEKPKKKSKGIGHSRTLSRVEAMGGVFTSSHLSTNSKSVQSIPDHVYSQLSNPQVTSPEAKKIHQDICVVSQRVHDSLKSIHEVLMLERERLQQAWTSPDLKQNASQQLATLCSTLSEFDIQSHHTKVHSLSLSSDSTEGSFCTVRADQRTPSMSRHSQRPPSVADSMAEYFDASEVIVCDSSSEAEASDESGLSDITTTSTSEPEEGHASATLKYRASLNAAHDKPRPALPDTGRRTALPAPGTDNSHIGIMSILYNNIGKDLSRVSMPVALNEPLSLLQRLSEELEYTELLDMANHIDDPYERMVYVAAFSISGYAWASWRFRYKPFNPVLGETYESHREDRGFRYVSEQVSHHPPISACHAESENFTFWQDQRWKNKFWGKSVEIISSGPVNVSLPRYGDHYEWNKAVTCIHNVLSQQRWLEHYGEVVIKNTKSDVCTCKITFVKSRYWSSDNSKNEVQGVVLDQAGEVVHRFGGLWHEGIFCDTLPTPKCIWKPNVQPDDHAQFYGFSRYARELNELTPELKKVLPPTDTRYRPDQRLLEEGKVAEADKRKDQVEEKQRERRKEMAKQGEEHTPRFFRRLLDESGREVWLYNGTYWDIRSDPGFAHTENLDLW
ncbi:oxysterol-binding protein-related protein 7-like isoform X1 [Synchiropus splendidus]|uniref:oxysterol-binding protein-related protein 7-like isoform X1 n=1 Tax=Synchiropus splendidus TaxID=270530 RepID=UPI00237EBBE3|nr:oxysterol-binding protein-related protein 7-like isoform X1 [Synchiropus splendidus]XP_053707757.1 oxysterol-binding protein-related protein 7-like isoform X1 [Synchiropus splendidus]XP_053707758.1 oxysterol-binding protein-related protein 7-like isoform X1 [Synchiropus splendidus]